MSVQAAVAAVPSPRRAEVLPDRSDGHHLGDHGNRCDPVMLKVVVDRLREAAAQACGDDSSFWELRRLDPRDIAWALAVTGLGLRQMQRHFKREVSATAQQQLAAAATPAGDGVVNPLYRLQQRADGRRPSTMLTEAQVQAVKRYPCRAQAFDALGQTDLAGMSRSTFYARWKELHPAARAGLSGGIRAMYRHETHLPRALGPVNEQVIVDEYDPKVELDRPVDLAALGLKGADQATLQALKPAALVLREMTSGLIVAARLYDHKPCAGDLLALYATYVVGWEADGTTVQGPAQELISDQGSNLIAEEVATTMRYVGTNANPYASYEPPMGGAIENGFRGLGMTLRALPGHRSGPVAKSGKRRLDEEARSHFADLEEAFDRWVRHEQFVHIPTSGPHHGMTHFERYRRLVDAGHVIRIPVADHLIARLAEPVPGSRTPEETKGVLFKPDEKQGRYYTSLQLEQFGGKDRLLLRRLPGNTDVVYAHTPDWRFCSLLWHPDRLPAVEAAAILQWRADRRAAVNAINIRTATDRVNGKNLPAARDVGHHRPVPVTSLARPLPSPTVGAADMTGLAGDPRIQQLLADPALLQALDTLAPGQLRQLAADAADAAGSADLDVQPVLGTVPAQDSADPADPAGPPQPAAGTGRVNSAAPVSDPIADLLIRRLRAHPSPPPTDVRPPAGATEMESPS